MSSFLIWVLATITHFKPAAGQEAFLPIMLPDMFAIPIIAINPVLRVKMQMCRIDYLGNLK